MAVGDFLRGILSLGSNVNKTTEQAEETQEGIVDKAGELTLQLEDTELILLKNEWQRKWEGSKQKKDIELKQEENEKYWLGEHYTPAQRKAQKRELVDNLVFEALETFLPVATRQVAEPTVDTIQDPVAQAFARKVMDRIVDVADVVRLRLKVKKAVRFWALYFLGVIKFGWSFEKNEIVVEAIRPQNLVLDPDSITDECEYDGYYVGHYRTTTASELIARFKGKTDDLKKALDKTEMGTKIGYYEWWTPDYVFWTLKDIVLAKSKNPHWNYEQVVEEPIAQMDEMGQEMPMLGADGQPMMTQKIMPGLNHFAQRKVPFAFLSVFSLGNGPYDNTNLVEQVLPQQDMINKRVRQIDRNADNTNAGSVVSGDVFTKEQARDVGEALRKGQTVWVPSGDVNRAYKRDIAPGLPDFMYQHLVDSRNELRNIFGVTGLSTQGIQSEETVRGKIMIKGSDTDRAALIVDHIEQFYDYIFNWFVQMMVVYYDTPREVNGAQGVDTIVSDEFVWPLVVSVKEGSLIPKDRLSMRNEAVELWSAGAIDPLTLAERLEEADPQEFVRRLVMWKMNPLSLLQEGDQFQLMQQMQQAQMGQAQPQEPQPGQPEQPQEAQQLQEQPNMLDQVPIPQ